MKPKTIIIASIVGIVIIGGLVLWATTQFFDQKPSSNNTTSPDFSTILPDGKTVDQLGGWSRVSPQTSDPVYAYSDTVDGVAITVSQQPLPESFKDDTDNKVADLAKGYSATNKQQSGDTSFYIGASADGPQSVIFVKKGLLILIKSVDAIDDASWIGYISKLN